jgi:hypothetical protein
MITIPEIRRQEPADTARTAAPYAYPAGAASFLTILHEVGAGTSPDTAPAHSVEAEADPSPAATQSDPRPGTTETESPAPETTESTEETTVLAAETEPASGEHLEAESNSPDLQDNDLAGDPTAPEDSTDLPDPAEQDVLTAPVPEGGQATGSGIGLPGSTESSTGPPHPRLPREGELETAAPQVPLRIAVEPDPGNPDDTPVSTVSELTLAVEETASNGKAATPDHTLPIPKSLNAFLAESALRAGSTDNTIADLHTLPDPVDGAIPEPTAAPQTTALEVGGVRADARATPRLPMANLPGGIAQQIHLMQQEGVKTMRLRLVPENLGELHIEVRGQGDHLHVRMIAASPAVRDALEGQMNDLKQALQKQGLTLNNVSIDTGEGQREAPGRQPYEAAPNTLANRRGVPVAADTAQRPPALAGTPSGSPNTTLNLFA